MPARSASAATASADSGVLGDGRTTAVQPAASAGASLRVTMAELKFQGVSSAATPTGCFSASMRRSAACGGMMSPYARLPSSANQVKKDAA